MGRTSQKKQRLQMDWCLFCLGIIARNYTSEKSICTFREFTRYSAKFLSMQFYKKYFLECYYFCTVKVDVTISDMFGVSASSIVNNETENPKNIESLIQKITKSKFVKVMEAIKDYQNHT